MVNGPAFSMNELEQESAELLPRRETLCVINRLMSHGPAWGGRFHDHWGWGGGWGGWGGWGEPFGFGGGDWGGFGWGEPFGFGYGGFGCGCIL
jgi:hypothetical protein